MNAEQLRSLYLLIDGGVEGTRAGRFVKFLEAVKIVDMGIYKGLIVVSVVNGENIVKDNVAQWEALNNQDKEEDRVHLNIYQQLRSDKLAYKRYQGAKDVEFKLYHKNDFIGYVNA